MESMVGRYRVVFLGTGVSTAIPNLGHVLQGRGCPVCKDALENPGGRNRRNNVSIALLVDEGEDRKRCVMIDCGKTMREAALNVLPRVGVNQVDAILITHGHADAMMGMDDVRDLQRADRIQFKRPALCSSDPKQAAGASGSDGMETLTCFRMVSDEMPIFGTAATLRSIRTFFPYLTAGATFLDDERRVMERRVAYVRLEELPSNSRWSIYGLPVENFPVWHGPNYESLAYAFGSLDAPALPLKPSEDVAQENLADMVKALGIQQSTVAAVDTINHLTNKARNDVIKGAFVTSTDAQLAAEADEARYAEEAGNLEGAFLYISDVHEIPSETLAKWRNRLIHTLVIDALDPTGVCSHCSLSEAIAYADALRPQRMFITGVGCDMGLHADIEAALQAYNPNYHCAYDGLVLSNLPF